MDWKARWVTLTGGHSDGGTPSSPGTGASQRVTGDDRAQPWDGQRPTDFAVDQHATEPQRRRPLGGLGELERGQLRRLRVVDPHSKDMADERLCDGRDGRERERHGEPEAVMGVDAAAQHPDRINPCDDQSRRP